MPIEFDFRVKGHTADTDGTSGSSRRFWLTITLTVAGILATVYFGLQMGLS